MTDKTPQKLREKPGEPGGEKARVRGWLEGLTYESSNGGERGLMPHHIEQFTEKLAPLVAGALLAEAKWWHEWYGQDHSDSHIILERMGRNGCAVCQRIAALERAAESKA